MFELYGNAAKVKTILQIGANTVPQVIEEFLTEGKVNVGNLIFNERRYVLGKGVEVVEELGTRYYYHKDEQRSTKYLSNEEKEIENIYWYDGYGRSRGKVEGVENRIRYTGQLYEEELEGYYVRTRNYREE